MITKKTSIQCIDRINKTAKQAALNADLPIIANGVPFLGPITCCFGDG